MKKLMIWMMLGTFLFAGCSSHERDNRFDRHGVAYNPNPAVEVVEIQAGTVALYRSSGGSCNRACVDVIIAFFQFLWQVILVLDELDATSGLAKQSVEQRAVALGIPSIPDVPSIPEVPSLPDFTADADGFYDRLGVLDAQVALDELDMPEVNARQYLIAGLDTLVPEEIVALLRLMSFGDLRRVADSLDANMAAVAAASLQSDSLQEMLAASMLMDSVSADALMPLINADSAAMTEYLWEVRGDSIRAQVSALLVGNLNQSKVPLLFVAMHRMYADLHQGLEPVKETMLGSFLQDHVLPDTTVLYEDVAGEFASSTLARLQEQMAAQELLAKQGDPSAPVEVLEFFSQYRGVYGE